MLRKLTDDQNRGGNPKATDHSIGNHENILPIGDLEGLVPIHGQFEILALDNQRGNTALFFCGLETYNFWLEMYYFCLKKYNF